MLRKRLSCWDSGIASMLSFPVPQSHGVFTHFTWFEVAKAFNVKLSRLRSSKVVPHQAATGSTHQCAMSAEGQRYVCHDGFDWLLPLQVQQELLVRACALQA